jgi:stearoyl-CoA desaturase (delta-9 desaturase)
MLDLISPPPSTAPPLGQEERPPGAAARVVTALIVGLPFVAVLLGMIRFRGHGVGLRDLLLTVVLYMLVGHGVTIGFHRLLAHKSFIACRPLKVALVTLGSMAFEGGPIGWVASHRRHHAFADTPEDPHSPQHLGRGLRGQLKGLWHAHVGWLFTARGVPTSRHAADLLADRDIVIIDALFPLWCVLSLAIPFGLGWLLGGTVGAAFSALLWAGLVRVFLLHHATWSVNSLCHTFGRRPFASKDHSTNVPLLAIVSLGESWHNGHHAFPRSARHGLLPAQLDSSALLISRFEKVGWVHDVHVPTPEAIERRRITHPTSR